MGKLVGLARFSIIVAACFSATEVGLTAQTFHNLNFDGTNGANPVAPLLQGIDGNLYGTTSDGGASSYCGPGGCGTVFKVTPRGALSTIYNFCSLPNCADGSSPIGGLVQGTNGNFYGTTMGGGPNLGGTVFELTPDGKLTALYNFCSLLNCADGRWPTAGLVQSANANFYGTTQYGGNNTGCWSGCGTVFEITPAGKLTTLYSFCSMSYCSDGFWPNTTLVWATDNNLYGTASEGGGEFSDAGTIFRVTLPDTLTTIHHLRLKTDGAIPNSLIESTDGNLYGTTQTGMTNFTEGGTVFRLSFDGEFTVLAKFRLGLGISNPYAGLVQASDANFYGTTVNGSVLDNGAIFQVTPSGELTTIYSFCSENCYGSFPNASLTQGTNGTLYGTTRLGGGGGGADGIIFSLSPDLAPFVEARPNFGEAGRAIGILGNDLAGTSGVSFNGTPATFTVVSDTFIRTTVPSGATSGTIEVTTTSTTLSSNSAFQVSQ